MEYQLTEPMNDFVMWGFVALLLGSGFFLLTFAQFTMRRIEKQIKKDGVAFKEHFDFGGTKIVDYAIAIVLSERAALRIERLIDVRVVRSYATKTDWWLGLLFLITMSTWILFMFIWYAWENF